MQLLPTIFLCVMDLSRARDNFANKQATLLLTIFLCVVDLVAEVCGDTIRQGAVRLAAIHRGHDRAARSCWIEKSELSLPQGYAQDEEPSDRHRNA